MNRVTSIRSLPSLSISAAVIMMFLAQYDSPELSAAQSRNSMSIEDIVNNKVHHGVGIFLNPFSETSIQRRSMLELIRWKLLSENRFERDYVNEEVVPVQIDWKAVTAHHSVSVTWINHASVLIRENGSSIIVDPVLFGLFWPIKDFSPLAFQAHDLPGIDAVLITHGHYDHLDIDSLKHFRDQARCIIPLGYADLLKENGMTRFTEMDWLDRTKAGSFEVTFLPSNHWTMRNPITGPNTALWGSYLIRTSSGKSIYLSGDTAYFDRFEEIGKMHDIDLAIFNLGAYEPRWFMKKSHINPEETVKAFRELRAKRLLVIHWGTFRLGDEPVHQPFLDIRKEMARAGLSEKLVELRHGQTMPLE
ncbi:MAG: MBL fold metallo-hydrolase [Desulfobacterota bacterium]|nr:MBL fold metallo-hydrolase [Thermodesulfobacteriota bacterium]